jgi:hypothetical protein
MKGLSQAILLTPRDFKVAGAGISSEEIWGESSNLFALLMLFNLAQLPEARSPCYSILHPVTKPQFFPSFVKTITVITLQQMGSISLGKPSP